MDDEEDEKEDGDKESKERKEVTKNFVREGCKRKSFRGTAF